jgi:hypothetical protein
MYRMKMESLTREGRGEHHVVSGRLLRVTRVGRPMPFVESKVRAGSRRLSSLFVKDGQ